MALHVSEQYCYIEQWKCQKFFLFSVDTFGLWLRYGKARAESSTVGTPSRISNLAVAAEHDEVGLHAYVYPNPANDHVAISVYRTFAEDQPVTGRRQDDWFVVRVVSMLGTEVARFDTRAGLSIELPVRHLPKGVYFVRVEQAGNPAESGTTSFVVE